MRHDPRPTRFPLLALSVLVLSGLAGAGEDGVDPRPLAGFKIERQVTVKATPEEAWEAFTGDVSGWWDHTFSGKPKKLFIEPKPGGGFYEIVDEAGHGILHATVTWAEPGKKLVFRGPLGLHGNALDLVHTFVFERHGESTRITATIQGAGHSLEGGGQAIGRAWHHFLVERFKPYVEARTGRE